MTAVGAVDRGLAAVNAVYEDGEPLALTAVTEERIADAIADLLHLARHQELDVDAVLEHGRHYYEGDLEGAADPNLSPPTPEEQIG